MQIFHQKGKTNVDFIAIVLGFFISLFYFVRFVLR